MEDLKQRILIIDADPKHVTDLSQLLREHDYVTRSTFDRYDAAAIIQSWQPDLVILDILIRSFNALDFLDDLRNNPATEPQKVLILSQPENIDMVTGPSPKVAAYLTKPVDFEELKKLLKQYAGESSPELRIPVLVADDDTEFSELLKMFLETNYYRPVMARTGALTIEKARTERPAVILLDLMMPDKDGFQVMNELQHESSTSEISVIVLSAIRLNTYQDCGTLTGEPEIISKQVSPEFLLQKIKNRLRGESGLGVSTPASAKQERAKPKVVLADDETELLYLMKEMMEKSGFEVFAAADGQEAMEQIHRENPDIAVLDYNMPIKDGLTLAQELKEDPLFAHLPIIVLTAISEKQSKMRGLNLGIDDYLIKPVDTDELIARIRMTLKRTKLVLDTNPLSRLPGNPSIVTRIERELSKNEPFAVLYADLNQFKAFNDAYGFDAGDRVIRATANLLVKLTRQSGETRDFIGHIGGDDFIIVTALDRAEELCKRIISGFDAIAPSFYNEDDRARGCIVSTDRQGNIKKFPFLSISVGIVHNKFMRLASVGQISQIGSELKKHAKTFQGSHYVVDRRRD